MKYIQIVQLLEQFADKHKDVKRFKSDTLDRLPDFEIESEAFPLIYAVPLTPLRKTYESGYRSKIYTFDIFCLVPRIDIEEQELDNVVVLNQTNININQTAQILFDLYEAIDNMDEIEILYDVALTPVNNYSNSKLQGVRGTFTFEVETDDSKCSLPLTSPLIIAKYECEND